MPYPKSESFFLQVSGEKIKQISEAWVLESHRKSGSGGIEDYLDPKTLQHLEDLNIIDPHTTDDLEPEPPPIPTKEILSGIADLTSGREKSGWSWTLLPSFFIHIFLVQTFHSIS